MDSKVVIKSILFGILAGVMSAMVITLVASLIFEKDFVHQFLALDGGILWSIALSIGNSIWFYNRERNKK